MTLLLSASLWILTHFSLYAVWLRHWPRLRSETGIFRFHLWSVATLALLAAAWVLLSRPEHSVAGFAAAVSLHGLYSVSFLELWSLTQGGYSLSILEGAAGGSNIAAPATRRALEHIGELKRCDRLAALTSFGLIDQGRQELALTLRGRLCYAALRSITVLAGLRSLG